MFSVSYILNKKTHSNNEKKTKKLTNKQKKQKKQNNYGENKFCVSIAL